MQFRLTRLAVLALVVSVAAAGCGKYSISNIRALKAFQDANGLYKKGEYKNAAARYEDAVQLNPDLGFAYFFLGNSYDSMYKPARKGEAENDANLPKAEANYKLAIEKLRNSTDEKEKEIRKLSYEYLIALYGPDKLNDFSKAEPLAKELIGLEPDNTRNYHNLGSLYKGQGRIEDAEAAFKKAIDVKPNDPLNYQMLAGFYNEQGEFEKTMDAFQRRAEIEPNNPEAWHTISTFYYDKVSRDKTLAKPKAAEYVKNGLAAEERALAINPEYFEALSFKQLLMRQQALLERDPAKQKALIEEADKIREHAIELQKKQNQGAGSQPQAGKKGK